MAIANFYTFSKRKNSTKQPTGSGTQLDVNLKSGTSLLSPTFLLSLSSRPDYNYINFEGRYYFVKDIISVRDNLWEIQADADPLASWKSTIGAAEALIMYATGGRNDIIDQRIPIESDIIVHTNSKAVSGFDIQQLVYGDVILSITGVGSFGQYLLDDPSDIYDVMGGVDAWWNNLQIGSVEDALKYFFYGGSAGECLKNVIALPIKLTIASPDPNVGPLETLYFGPYECKDTNGNPIEGRRVNNPIYRWTTTVSIPWHYSDWRRHSPYTEVHLYLPLIGNMQLSADELISATALDITYSLNIASGDLAVEVAMDSPIKIIATASNNVAMSLPYGSANIPATRDISAIATAIGAGITAGAAAAKAGAAAVGVGASAVGSAMGAGAVSLIGAGEQSGGGGLSGGASQGLYKQIMCTTYSKQLTDSQINLDPIMGKPIFEKHTIGTYSGYVQTDGLSIAGNMTDMERDAINAAFNGGAYYE